MSYPRAAYPHPSSFPSGESYPAGPGTPAAVTAYEQALARDLSATVTFTLPGGCVGWRAERATGAGQPPPVLPYSGGGWTHVQTDADGPAGLTLSLPANDADYTLAVWPVTTGGTWGEPATINVFGLDEPVAGPGGPRYASIQVTTTRAGWPRIEVDTDPAFTSPTTYDAETDPGGWTICDTTGEVTSDAGDVMPAGGFPAGSDGKYLRVRLPAAFGNRYARGYQGSEPTP